MDVVTITEELLALFDRRRVFHSPQGRRRWRLGEPLALMTTSRIEPYVNILAGEALPRLMGAFSYSHSGLRPYVAVGRYCSIGSRVAWLAGAHPHDWATTSPVAYDDNPLAGLR